MITSDILGKISVYDIKKFNLVCSTENYIPKEKKDELKAVALDIENNNIYCGFS
jgi:hypothetical protein